MKKTEIKKPLPQENTKVVSKKDQKNGKNAKPKTQEKMDYPSWTMPEHLNESDHKALKRFYELFISGKIISAFSFASNFETIVKEAIPAEIWEQSKAKISLITPRKRAKQALLSQLITKRMKR